MGTGNTTPPAPGPAPDPLAQASADALAAAQKSMEEAIKTQQVMMVMSAQVSNAMAYLQMAMSASGKVAGR